MTPAQSAQSRVNELHECDALTSTSFMSGAKEIDIAATVEHLRDQRPSMVKTKVCDNFSL